MECFCKEQSYDLKLEVDKGPVMRLFSTLLTCLFVYYIPRVY